MKLSKSDKISDFMLYVCAYWMAVFTAYFALKDRILSQIQP